ncbi:MAG: TfoX/Sxy family protein, partial [Burkholderiales bacterium]
KVVCFIVVPPSYPIIQILHLFDWMRGLNQSFPNLGPACAVRLQAVGILNLKDLREMAAVGAYRLVKNHGYPSSVNLLWAIYGALHGIKWNQVPDNIKAQLKAEIQSPIFLNGLLSLSSSIYFSTPPDSRRK